jgi:hypothetical protein
MGDARFYDHPMTAMTRDHGNDGDPIKMGVLIEHPS